MTIWSQGYAGTLCDACNYTGGYFSKGSGKCGICDTFFTTIAIFILKFIFLMSYDIYFIYSTRKMCMRLGETGEVTPENFATIERTSYLRIFNTYCQIITVAYSFNFFTSDLQMLEQFRLSRSISYFQQSSQTINPLTTIYSSLECVYFYLGLNNTQNYL